MNTTVKMLIANRDWDALRAMWDEWRPNAHGVQRRAIPTSARSYIRREAKKDGIDFPANLGGARDGAGRPANIAANLDRLERSIAAAEAGRPALSYAEAAALFARADELAERIERLMVETPDYRAE